jgi:hypothetical protein
VTCLRAELRNIFWNSKKGGGFLWGPHNLLSVAIGKLSLELYRPAHEAGNTTVSIPRLGMRGSLTPFPYTFLTWFI